MEDPASSVLITGAAGYLGRQLVRALASAPNKPATVVAMDVRELPSEHRLQGIQYHVGDVRDPAIEDALRSHAVDTVVHLAAIVTPGKQSSREFEYSVDVLGTENVLAACLRTGVRKIIVTSSGAAYGYHANNPCPLREADALRGNAAFAYSHHKRLVEELLARYRREHPELRQLIFRPGAILGVSVSNQITALFEKPVILGVRGSDAPFVFIWDHDVVACLLKGISEDRSGIYNLAGDGVMTPREIARRTGKPYLAVPPSLLGAALRLLRPLGLTQYGPEQVDFLRYRPVLSNDKLKTEFGYTPQLTTVQVFELYWQSKTRERSNAQRA